MAKKRLEVSTDVEKLANEIISSENMDISPAKIMYLLVYPNSLATRII